MSCCLYLMLSGFHAVCIQFCFMLSVCLSFMISVLHCFYFMLLFNLCLFVCFLFLSRLYVYCLFICSSGSLSVTSVNLLLVLSFPEAFHPLCLLHLLYCLYVFLLVRHEIALPVCLSAIMSVCLNTYHGCCPFLTPSLLPFSQVRVLLSDEIRPPAQK